MLVLSFVFDLARTVLENKPITIKYHQGYDPTLAEKLSAVAAALGGEFSDRPATDSTREMCFNFENQEGLGKFFRVFKELLAEREEDQDGNGKDPNNQNAEQCEQAIKTILPLIERSSEKGSSRGILVNTLVGLESRKVKLGLMRTLRVIRTPRQPEIGIERNNQLVKPYGNYFREFFSEQCISDEDFQVGLKDGDRMAELLGPMISASLDSFNLVSGRVGHALS
jgi:hypothetical protein